MERKKYNGVFIPDTIKTGLIVSAFANEIELWKVQEYTEIMKAEMLGHSFPAIIGFPFVIDENDLGEMFMTGEDINETHIGKTAWKVTDGHHRTLAAIEANIPYLETELDYSTITNENDL